jgi:hypothetical protein
MLTRASSRINDFTARHGLITVEMLEEQGILRDTAYHQLWRLERKKKLQSKPLYGRTLRYWPRGQPGLGPQQLAIAYAVAMHCCQFSLFKPHTWEVRSAYPWLDGIDFATEAENVILFRVHISGKPDAQVRKALELHRRLSQYPEYLERLQAGRIVVRILTATEQKAREINYYINKANSPVPIDYAVVPGYEQVLGGIDHA